MPPSLLFSYLFTDPLWFLAESWGAVAIPLVTRFDRSRGGALQLRLSIGRFKRMRRQTLRSLQTKETDDATSEKMRRKALVEEAIIDQLTAQYLLLHGANWQRVHAVTIRSGFDKHVAEIAEKAFYTYFLRGQHHEARAAAQDWCIKTAAAVQGREAEMQRFFEKWGTDFSVPGRQRIFAALQQEALPHWQGDAEVEPVQSGQDVAMQMIKAEETADVEKLHPKSLAFLYWHADVISPFVAYSKAHLALELRPRTHDEIPLTYPDLYHSLPAFDINAVLAEQMRKDGAALGATVAETMKAEGVGLPEALRRLTGDAP
ncbi:hypothetical protein EON80_09415 [bacterium]|nr:MAG: hypothetical protein EON80_09415 [bacterium]